MKRSYLIAKGMKCICISGWLRFAIYAKRIFGEIDMQLFLGLLGLLFKSGNSHFRYKGYLLMKGY